MTEYGECRASGDVEAEMRASVSSALQLCRIGRTRGRSRKRGGAAGLKLWIHCVGSQVVGGRLLV